MESRKVSSASKNKRLVVIAVALTVATIVVLKLYANSIESKYKAVEDPVQVMVSVNAVAKGEEIKDLGMYVVPRKHVHPDAILYQDPTTGAGNAELVKGSKASRALGPKQILLWSDVLPKEGREARETLGRVITEGHRGVTVRADVGSMHGGLLRAGDRVDVLCTVAAPKIGDVITKTVLQNITVLAVGGQIHDAALGKRPRRSAPTVTLEVTPEDAELLVFAEQKGDLSLIVRPNADTVTNTLPGRSFWDIFEKPDHMKAPRMDTLGKTLRAVQEELKGIRTIKIERVGDKILIAGVVYTEEEIERVKTCAASHADCVESKVTASPRATKELRRQR